MRDAVDTVKYIGHDGFEHDVGSCPRCAIDEVLARLTTAEQELAEVAEREKNAAGQFMAQLDLRRAAEAHVEALSEALREIAERFGFTSAKDEAEWMRDRARAALACPPQQATEPEPWTCPGCGWCAK